MSGRDRWALFDRDRSTYLGDLGATGWHAAVCVAPDGTDRLWLITDDDGRSCGCACSECAPHEQGGPVKYPCSAVARSGRPCRNKVRRPGGLCPAHERWPTGVTRRLRPILDDWTRHG